MKVLKTIGWGVTIYALMFLLWDVFTIYGFTQGSLPRVALLVFLIIVMTIAGRSLGYRSWKDILPHSIVWAVMMGMLDAVLTVPFSGWAIYSNANLWVGYALVLLVPLIAPFTYADRSPKQPTS